MRWIIAITFIFPLYSAAQSTSIYPSVIIKESAIANCRDSAEKLVYQAIDLMKRNYYKKDEINWAELTEDIMAKLNRMSSCDELHDIINGCFAKINETHSFIMPVMSAARYTNNREIINETPALYTRMGPIAYAVEKDNIGYLSVSWVATTDAATCTLIADSIQSIIELLDKKGVSRWIIDLRKNTGGNCWPMLAGLGPLIGEGICGYFISPNSKSPWRYKDGASLNGNSTVVSTSKKGYQLINPIKKIAVLIGPKTSSSGEIAAIAFKGKENTSFFGEPSAGFTTANSTYPLRDGSILVLTVCKEADRTGKICEGRIVPDESIHTGSKEDDAAKNAAVRWLQSF